MMQWWCAAQGTAWTWQWKAYPGVWIFVGLMALLYSAAHRRHGSHDSGSDDGFAPRTRVVFSAVGILLLWIALDWPVGALGAGYLASVHMVQFLLIAVAAPPFLLLGIPRAGLEHLLGRRWARIGLATVGQPLVAMGLFMAVMGITHWPAFADAMMSRQWGSFVLDMMWLGSGLAFWWPVAVNLPERDWIGEPFKMGYLIAATLVNTGVFAFLTFSDVPVYATFELAPPVGSLSTRDDQLVAGLLMKVGGAFVLWTSITVLWFRWYRRSQREGDPGQQSGAPRPVVPMLVLVAAAVVGSAGCASDAGVAGLEVGPVVIGAPLTPERAALYLVAVNRAASDDTLTAVEVDGVGRVELHHTMQAGGMMQMMHAHGGLVVPAGGELRMAPGGDHAMLEEITDPFVEGTTRGVQLHFAHAGTIAAEARIVALTAIVEVLATSR